MPEEGGGATARLEEGLQGTGDRWKDRGTDGEAIVRAKSRHVIQHGEQRSMHGTCICFTTC